MTITSFSLARVMILVAAICAIAGVFSPAGETPPKNAKEKVSSLIADLRKIDTGTRNRGASELGRCGLAAAAAAVPLAELVCDPRAHPSTRSSCAQALGKIGLEAGKVVPMLTDALLRAKDRDVRRASARALGEIGPQAAPAAPMLARLLCGRKADPTMRHDVATALAKIGPHATSALPTLTQALRSAKDGDVRREAVTIIGKMGPAAIGAVPTLIRAVSTPAVRELPCNTPQQRMYADRLMLQSKGVSTEMVTRRDSRGKTQMFMRLRYDVLHAPKDAAIKALGQIGPSARSAVPTLVAVLTAKSDSHLQDCAIEALGRIGPGAAGATPALVKVIEGEKSRPISRRRNMAIKSLGQIGPTAKAAVPLLTALIGEREDCAAVRTLGHMGEHAKPAVKRLAELARFGRGWPVREASIEALGNIGPAARKAVPELEKLVPSLDKGDSRAAIALWKITADYRWLPHLRKALTRSDRKVRVEAAWLLWRHRSHTWSVVLAADKAIGGSRTETKIAAARLIARIGPAARGTVPALAAQLKREDDPELRRALLEALGRMGSASVSVMPLISKHLQDKYPEVRAAADKALSSIRSAARTGSDSKLPPDPISGEKLARKRLTTAIGALRAGKKKDALAKLKQMIADFPESAAAAAARNELSKLEKRLK